MKKQLLIVIAILSIAWVAPAQPVTDSQYKQKLDDQYASGLFKDRNAYMFTPQEDAYAIGRLNVFQYLQGRVPGLQINTYNPVRPVVTWRMSTTAIFLDEVRIDASILNMIDLNSVGLIKIFRPPFAGAFGNGPGGAIAVYTLQDSDE